MIDVAALPAINASLNAASAVLLVIGYAFIRRGQVTRHLVCMLLAFATSTLFLVSYLYYHFHAGHVEFQGRGWVRAAYLGVLFSHIVLAIVIVPLALVTLYRGLRQQFGRHRLIARWTLPIWLYVSVTGVVVYWMLYQM